MKKILILIGAIAAYGTDCTISDTVRTPFGGYFAGRIVVALNSPGSAQPLYSGSQTLTGWQTTIEVPASANGVVAFTLVCTDTITPSGTSYSARYQPTSGSGWAETWSPATGTTTIRAMRATTVPTPTTTFQASQIVPGSNGQVLTTTAGASAWGSVPACATCVVTSGSYADPAWLTSLAGSKVSGNIAGNAGTATALAANGTNCAAGTFPLGVDASGNSESCTALPTTITGTANQITASASTGAVTLSLPATITGLTSVTSTSFTGALTGNASTATALASTVASGRIWYGNGTGAPGSVSTFVYDSANGRLGVGTASPDMTGVFGDSTGTKYVAVDGAASGTTGGSAYIIRNGGAIIGVFGNASAVNGGAYDSTFRVYSANALHFSTGALGTPKAMITALGNLLLGTTTDLGYGLHAANKGTNGNLLVFDPTATTGTTKAVFAAGQGQSGNILEVRGYNATPGSGSKILSISTTNLFLGEQVASTTFDMGNNARIRMAADGTTWDTSLSRASAGVLQVGDGGANANGYLSAARIGVGTASPLSLLHVESTGGALARFAYNSTYYLAVNENSMDVYGGNQLAFKLAGSEKARIAVTTGNLLIGGTTDGNYKLDVQNSGSSGTLRVYDQTATTGNTKEVIRAGAGQSTNLTEWQNNAGTVLLSVSSAGAITSGSYIISGASSALGWNSRGYLLANADGVVSLNNNAGTDFNRVQFGGTTSSFPALKRSSAILQARLADDSAMTDMQVSSIITKQSTPSASTDACTAGALWADASYVYACTSSGVIKRATLASF